MLTLKDYVNWGITHSDKTGSAEGVPLVMENCVKNKKMKQFEVYGNSIQNGTPTPENPIEVESVGEKCTKNLYDAKKYPMRVGYYIHGNSGNDAANTSYASVRTYIPCIELRGKTITFGHTGGNAPGIAYYDENNAFISGVMNQNGTKITSTVPETASYYRFCVLAEYADVAQVEFGDTPTEYEPYGKYKIPVTVRGKNLVDLSEFVSKGKMKLNDASTGEYEFINTYGMPNLYVDFNYDDDYVLRCEVMAVKEQNIIFSGCNASGVSITTNRVGFSVAGIVGEWKTVTKVISKADISDIAYFIFGGTGGLAAGTKIRGFQIERGSVATEYEPYTEPITTNVYLNEPLGSGDVLNFKDKKVSNGYGFKESVECDLPTLTAQTSIVEIGTTVAPSNMKGKYIKR